MPAKTAPSGPEKTLPIYVIFGGEDFLKLHALHDITHRVLGPSEADMAVAEFDGDSAKLADVLDEVRTASLLAPIRLVIVREADDFVSEHREVLEKYLKAPSPTGVLVLVCKSWPATTRLYKQVGTIGGNISCKPPEAREMPGWLAQHCRSAYKCTLEGIAARRLIDLVGPNLGQLDTELAKLSTYVATRDTIRLADVDELVGASRVEKVFGITDCIARRDAKGALEIWGQVIATDRDAPYRAIGGLAYGFRKLAEAKRLVESGLSAADAGRKLAIWADPAGLKSQLDRFSLPQWQGHLVKLLRLDVGAKTGLARVDTAVEKFIVSLCEAA